jgi:hypothetical protein
VVVAVVSTRSARVAWAAIALAAGSVLAIARVLVPDPAGFGTHVQLGLPACAFRVFTKLPCPACGLTTAFAHMARLEITSAVHAHVLSVPLFSATVIALPYASLACVRALPLAKAIEVLRLRQLAVMMAFAVLLCWIARVAALLL